MTKRMLIDATHAEETRVVVLDGSRLEDYDVETSTKKQLKGNIYLAKVVRVEPSLQAAFVEYGAGRHGFLAFGEIHPDYYQIPVADRQRLLDMAEAEARAEQEQEDADAARAEAGPPRARREPHDLEPAEPHAEDMPAEDVTAEDAPAEDTPAGETEPAYVPAPPPSTIPAAIPAHRVFADAGSAPADPEPANMPRDPAELGADLAPEAQEPAHEWTPGPAAEDGSADPEPAAEAQAAQEDGFEEAAEDAPPPETVGGDSAEEVSERRPSPRFLRNYKIQEVIRRRQILLVQVVKEERGTKGAALTTYISLAGRYCVLMPNSPRGGGISRKITAAADRKRLREITAELDIPRGMGLIVRTAGANRPKPEIKRDCEYLLRMWDEIRERTLASVAPALIYEEANLIKRAIRDGYSRDIEEVVVDGEDSWKAAREFMRMLMPTHAKKVMLWRNGGQPLFAHEQVEAQLDAMLSPTVQLRSGGYLVINQTEALVAIDVNSGRSTRERGVEETALRTNLEAADEAARQLRLRDLAGLIVIDFIDMEARRHNAMVERRVKDALKSDRARIQVGHISHFGLLEMSRQRLRPSLVETSFAACPHCGGTGHVRSTESSALHVLRAIEDEGAKRRAAEIVVHVAGAVALYILNHKRVRLAEIEARTGMRVGFAADETLIAPQARIERVRAQSPEAAPPAIRQDDAAVRHAPELMPAEEEDAFEAAAEGDGAAEAPDAGEMREEAGATTGALDRDENGAGEAGERRRRRRRRRRGGRREDGIAAVAPEREGEPAAAAGAAADEGGAGGVATTPLAADEDAAERGRRRGRRGGRRRREEGEREPGPEPAPEPVASYAGPTPADPFGDHAFGLFDAIDAVAEQAAASTPAAPPASPAPSATAATPAAPPQGDIAANLAPAIDVPAAAPAPATPADDPLTIPEPPAPLGPASGPEEETPAQPAIRPVLITAGAPPQERRRGWWRR